MVGIHISGLHQVLVGVEQTHIWCRFYIGRSRSKQEGAHACTSHFRKHYVCRRLSAGMYTLHLYLSICGTTDSHGRSYERLHDCNEGHPPFKQTKPEPDPKKTYRLFPKAKVILTALSKGVEELIPGESVVICCTL